MLDPNDTPGRRLRALREARKLDIERVAAQLHLQRHVVESIEGDHYERLPAPVFVVGYLKNYARLLGADPTPIVAAYRALVPAREISLSQALQSQSESSSASGPGRWVWLTGVLLVGLAAGAAGLWLRGQGDSGPDSEALALSTKVEDSASLVAAPTTNLDSSNAANARGPNEPGVSTPPETEATIAAPPESIPLRGAESRSLAGTNTATAPGPTAPPAPAETLVAAHTLAGAQTAPTDSFERDADEERTATGEDAEADTEPQASQTASTEVVLEFTGTSWVDVRGSNGRVVLNGEMRSGDRRVLDGEPPYKLVIGNAAATQLTVGGRRFDLKRRAQGNVARFSLDPSSVE